MKIKRIYSSIDEINISNEVNYVCWNCVTLDDKFICTRNLEPLLPGNQKYYYDFYGIHEKTGRKWGPDGYEVNGFDLRGIHAFTKTNFNPQGYNQD